MNQHNDSGRYGTSSVDFKERSDVIKDGRLVDTIYYYGGGKMFNRHTSLRECINQVIKFVPTTGEFKTMKQSGAIVKPRRYHTACSFGKYMIIHGGVDDLGRVLDDVACYDMQEHLWQEVQVIKPSLNKYLDKPYVKAKTKFNDGPGGLFFHKWTPVFYNQRYKYWNEYLYEFDFDELESDQEVEDPLIKLPELEWGMLENFIKQEGIYCFGGKGLNGYISDKLWCLKLFNKVDALSAIKNERREKMLK